MRVLLLDNHDSFSAILGQYLEELAGEKPLIYRNDALTREELEALEFDAAVLSPGPGHPANVRDFGVCRDLLQLFPNLPVLGVCLGHQGLAHFAGARVAPLPGALHGRPDRIAHDGKGIFRGMPADFEAVRYHSLAIEADSLPGNIEVTARSRSDGTVQGVAFRDRPWYGVQFHPESIGTPEGKALLANFLDLASAGRERARVPAEVAASSDAPAASSAPGIPHREIAWREPAEVFERFFPEDPRSRTGTFWFDASHRPAPEKSGWPVTVLGRADASFSFSDWNSFRAWINGLSLDEERTAPWPGYRGGPVGQLDYELYHDTLGMPSEPASPDATSTRTRWMLPEGYLVFEPLSKRAYAAWEGSAPPAWLQEVLDAWDRIVPIREARERDALPVFAAWKPLLTEEEYTRRVRSLQDSIGRGESYEACLTHDFSVRSPAGARAVFSRLRGKNPAPYAAWLAFPGLNVLSVSPELFLERSSDGVLRSRPIKGTRRRGRNADEDESLRHGLLESEKDRAENRMIVDLTRHDFNRVCASGSVEVSAFLEVETHPAVFQMVSEVRGVLAPGATSLDAVAACFPGGSMTGAPKERTVELLAALEAAPRGVYSGALGWFTRGGAFSLSMAIRTLENRGDSWRIGCGGAVLADSDPEAEWREALLKARSVIDASSI